LLQYQQCVYCIAIESVGTQRVSIELSQIQSRSKISQQQESALEIGSQNARIVQAHLSQVSSYLYEWPAVFLRRRRIHNDITFVTEYAKIAAEARIGRRGFELRCAESIELRQPVS
jgi:hypothetical protein